MKKTNRIAHQRRTTQNEVRYSFAVGIDAALERISAKLILVSMGVAWVDPLDGVSGAHGPTSLCGGPDIPADITHISMILNPGCMDWLSFGESK